MSSLLHSADPTAQSTDLTSLGDLLKALHSSTADIVEYATQKWVRTVGSLGCAVDYTGYIPKFELPDGAILVRKFGATRTFHDGSHLWVLMDPDDRIIDADITDDQVVGVADP